MKLTKQTVYLPVKIDDEFWTKWDNGEKPDYDLAHVETGENIESWVNEKEGYFFTPEQLNEYTANVITTTLETAADKAELISTPYSDWCTECSRSTDLFVSSDSITDTFEEIFKKFKV